MAKETYQIVRGTHLPQGDTHFPKALQANPLFQGVGSYQLKKIEAALPFVKVKGIALDIGAHVGLWTRVLASEFATVHAFEPVFGEAIRMNTTPRFRNVTVHDMALGMMNGEINFHKAVGNSGHSRVSPSGNGEVPIRRLDDLVETGLVPAHVDFIKIDVEGYEYHVILGAREFIKLCKPVMVVEQKPNNAEAYGIKTGHAIDLLKEWGAKVMWIQAGDYCLTW